MLGLDLSESNIEIVNARLSTRNGDYINAVYPRLQRHGFLKRDVQRLIHLDRNTFAAAMVAAGDTDAMITGMTRSFGQCLEEVSRVIAPAAGSRVIGLSALLAKGRTIFVADTSINMLPDPEDLVEIACGAAAAVRRLVHTPRIAFLSFSTFGHPDAARSEPIRRDVELMDARGVDFEYEGEMPPDIALDRALWDAYPFQRLSEPANVLVMPGIHSAAISTKLLQVLGDVMVVGPMLIGLSNSVQICALGDSVSRVVTMATLAAFGVNLRGVTASIDAPLH